MSEKNSLHLTIYVVDDYDKELEEEGDKAGSEWQQGFCCGIKFGIDTVRQYFGEFGESEEN